MDGVKQRAVDFVEGHPWLLLGCCVVLTVIVAYFLIRDHCGGRKKRAREPPSEDCDEMDELIERIHESQKKRASRA